MSPGRDCVFAAKFSRLRQEVAAVGSHIAATGEVGVIGGILHLVAYLLVLAQERALMIN